VAQLYLFGAQLIAGVGQSLKHTLGISFLDDNIKKSKTPALISKESFVNYVMLGEL
jgi:solute carrier organic anion transporter family, member 5A